MTVNSTKNRLVEKMGDKNKLKKKARYAQHLHIRLQQKKPLNKIQIENDKYY